MCYLIYCVLFIFTHLLKLLYSRERQYHCCIKILSASLFFWLPKMYGRVESRRQVSCIHKGADGTDLHWTTFRFFFFFFWGVRVLLVIFNIPDTLANSRDHISSNHLVTRCTWSRFLLACHPEICAIFSPGNICALFTLGIKFISNYFCSLD